jgi:hypothetical protein
MMMTAFWWWRQYASLKRRSPYRRLHKAVFVFSGFFATLFSGIHEYFHKFYCKCIIFIEKIWLLNIYINYLSSAAAWLLGSRVRIPMRAWMFVSCVWYVVLSCVGRGLCDGLVTRPEESYLISQLYVIKKPEWLRKNLSSEEKS